MPGRLLADQTWPEVAAAIENGDGVILPVGATEQHGPHLPLSTDHLLATDLALAVAEETGCLVAPAITYGYRSRPQIGGGQGFVGTTSLSGQSLMTMVADVLRELVRHGWRRLVLLNWHMENTNFIYEAAWLAHETATARGPWHGKIMVIESPFDQLSPATMDALFDGDFPGWAIEHAGVTETSLMMHLHPELVRTDRIIDDTVGRRVDYDMLPIQRDLTSRSGVLWKASRARPDLGARVWSEIVPPLVRMVNDDLPSPAAAPPGVAVSRRV